MAIEYVVLCGSVVGGGDRSFETCYSFDGRRFASRSAAIRHGFTLGRSDDFNVGVVEDGRLVSLDWMGGTVDSDPMVLAVITEQVGLR